jgi:hypothetical protein
MRNEVATFGQIPMGLLGHKELALRIDGKNTTEFLRSNLLEAPKMF